MLSIAVSNVERLTGREIHSQAAERKGAAEKFYELPLSGLGGCLESLAAESTRTNLSQVNHGNGDRNELANSVAAIYETHEQAEQTVKELQQAGVDMKSLSIVGRDTHTDEHVVGYYTAGDRMMYWGKVGAFWGGFWGLLFGSGLFFIPGLGPILAAGPIVAWIVAGLEGAVVLGGVSAIGAGLIVSAAPRTSCLSR